LDFWKPCLDSKQHGSFVELALAQNPNGSAMPVGVLTAYAWKTSKQEFLEAGRYKRIEIKQLA
jgi:hypothetical protein